MFYTVPALPNTPHREKVAVDGFFNFKQSVVAFEGPCIVRLDAEELFDEVAPAYESPVMLSPSWGRLLACARNQQRKTKDSHHDYFEGAFENGVDIKEGLEARVIELILGS